MPLPGAKCPTCEHGALKTARDLADGYCDICRLTKHGPSGYDYYWEDKLKRVPFRSEAELDREGIYDDD